MNREELPQEASREDKMRDALKHYEELATKACWHRSDIPDAIRAYYAPLPPAEGAVPDNAAEQNKRMREWFKERTGLDDTLLSIHMEQIDVMLKGVQQQPTAEGAEEILEKHLNLQFKDTPEDWTVALIQFNQEKFIAAMHEFATLHAQRIAEKMVSERLRGELIKYSMYASEQWCDTSDRELSEKNIDKYLKSRESHE